MRLRKPLLFFIIIFSMISSLFSVSVLGVDDINFTFKRDVFYNETNFDFDNSSNNFNIRNTTSFTGLYPATFSFTNDIVGSIPNGWLNVLLDTVGVIESFNGHDKVIELIDNDNSEAVLIRTNIDSPINDSIFEMWLAKNSIELGNSDYDIRLFENDLQIIVILIEQNDLNFFSGSEISIKEDFIIENIWFHLKLVLNDSFNTFDIFINGILEGNNLPYNINSTLNGIDLFDIRTNTNDFGYICYFDGLGYSFPNIEYTNIFFDTSSESNNPIDITFDGTFFWLLDQIDKKVYKYDATGVYQEFSFDLQPETLIPTGITHDGNFLWIVDKINKIVDKYNTSGFDQEFNFDISLEISTPSSITFDGNFFWILDNFNGKVYKYNATGVYQEFNFVFINGENATAITFDSNFFWILDNLNDMMYQYNSTGVYQEFSFDISSESNNPVGITFNENFFWILDLSDKKVYKYSIFIYVIGSNIHPTIITNSEIKEPNRDEFSLTDLIPTEQQRAIGSDDFGEWNEFEEEGDKVNIVANKLFENDRKIRMIHDVEEPKQKGIEKSFDISGNIFNITYEVNFSQFNIGQSEFKTVILSKDESQVLRVFFENKFFRHGTGVGTIIESGLSTNETYTINLYINYNDDLAIIRFKKEGILSSITIIPLLLSGKEGLGTMGFSLDGGFEDNMEFDLDYVGVYKKGVSLTSEFGYMIIPRVNPNIWFFNNHSVFSFDINSSQMSFLISETPHSFGIGGIRRLTPIDNYLGFSRFSVNDIDFGLVFIGRLIIQIFNQTQINEITIEGTKLTEGSNEYFLQFTHEGVSDNIGGVDITESFFYTDTSNRLQFTHISNDTDTEFIQARFNINDISSNGLRVSFRSLINNNAKGFFRISYTETSDFIPIPFVLSTTTIQLSQGKIIRDLIIIITDLDNDLVSGLSSGFFDKVKLLFSENIQITIITLSLLGMIVPLIIILTPTLALRELYGKGFVIPIFLLMSLILVIGGIIPIWLFFIIAISSSLFLMKRTEIREMI